MHHKRIQIMRNRFLIASNQRNHSQTPDRNASSPDRNTSSPDRNTSSPDRNTSSPDRNTSSPDRNAQPVGGSRRDSPRISKPGSRELEEDIGRESI